MSIRYAKYAAAKIVRVRIEPIVVKDKVKVFYENCVRQNTPEIKNFRNSLPEHIKSFPKLEKVNTVIIVGKTIKTAKDGLIFMAESLATLKDRKPFVDLTAQQLLWDRKFFTPLFFQKFITWQSEVDAKQTRSKILEVKKQLLSVIKGTVLLKPYKSINAKEK